MELHQLRYVAEIARHGSFTAAAQTLHISQSGVSAQVAKLERELGVRIFQRGARTALPTPEGRTLLSQIETALTAVGTIRTLADELSDAARGQLRLGTVTACTIRGYLSAFADFRRDHPGVQVTASEGNSSDLIADLAAGNLDVALVAHADPLPDTFEAHTIVEESLVVGVRSDHPWASCRSVSPTDLADQDVLTLPHGTGVRTALEKTCATAGIKITPAVEVGSPDAAVELATQGAGVAVLSASMIGELLISVNLRPSMRTALSLVTRTEPGAAAQAFAHTLRTRLG